MSEHSDATQEGVSLPPATVTRLLAQEEARAVIIQHLNLCPFASLKIEERVRWLESRLFLLLGFMIGSGIIGGTAGATLVKLISR